MSDEKTDNTDEPSKAELHNRVQQLESTVEKLMPSRRDALRLGAAGIAGAAGLGAASQSADASTGSAGQIGDVNNRPDVFADTVNANNVTGARQGCRVFLSSDQGISEDIRTKVQFDSEVYDSGSNFDTGTHNWTCPEAGLYFVNVKVRFTGGSNGDSRQVAIGSGPDAFPSNEGAILNKADTQTNDSIFISTINKYAANDTIAGHSVNFTSNDTIASGNTAFDSFMEVAFLGGL